MGIVMTSITAASLPQAARSRDRQSRFDEIRRFWREFADTVFNPYRPELHYMRGPGPAWHAKHGASSTAGFDRTHR